MTNREQEIIKKITDILKVHLNPKKVILFGSRAKNDSSSQSDFDFAIDANKPDISLRRLLEEKIEKIAGLYKVDIVYLPSVDIEFKNIILETGKIIYEK